MLVLKEIIYKTTTYNYSDEEVNNAIFQIMAIPTIIEGESTECFLGWRIKLQFYNLSKSKRIAIIRKALQ